MNRERAVEEAQAELAPEGRRLLLIMIDGLPASALERAFEKGAMPKLVTLLDAAGRPSAELTMLSTFPSATSPGVQEMLSGRASTLASLPVPAAVHAFDRERRRVVRSVTSPEAWEWPVPDLFDVAAASGLEAISVFEAAWDGASMLIPTRNAVVADAALDLFGVTEFDGDRGPVEELVHVIEHDVPPDVIFLVMNAWDLNAHFHGPESAHAELALTQIDALLGDVFDALARTRSPTGRRLLDETTVMLTADHGMVKSGKHIDLAHHFERDGHVTYDASTLGHVLFRERLGETWTRWPDAILVSGGSNVTQVYLRKETGAWSDDADALSPGEQRRARFRPDPIETARKLTRVEGVSQVLRLIDNGATETRVEVLSLKGRALVIGRADGRSAYVVGDHARHDPFGYLGDQAVAPSVCRASALNEACFLDREAWLVRTQHARYPNAVPYALQGFHQERFTGDLIVTALPGYTFLSAQQGDHGNFEREAMIVPFLINGPGVSPGCKSDRPLRLVDVMPSAAVLLGASPTDAGLTILEGRPVSCVSGP